MSKEIYTPLSLNFGLNDPATPPIGKVLIFNKLICQRSIPHWLNGTGSLNPAQSHLGFKSFSCVNPASGTTAATATTAINTAFTNLATLTNPTPTSTRLATSARRTVFSTTAIAGNVAYHRQNTLMAWRGNAAGLGGFFFTMRFGFDSLVAGNRAFVGLADSVANPTNVDPLSSTTPGRIGIAVNTNTGNLFLVNNTTGAAPSTADLGASMPLNTTDIYELIMACQPNGGNILIRVSNLSTGAVVNSSRSTNIGASTTFFAPQLWITNNATAAACGVALYGWSLENDY